MDRYVGIGGNVICVGELMGLFLVLFFSVEGFVIFIISVGLIDYFVFVEVFFR